MKRTVRVAAAIIGLAAAFFLVYWVKCQYEIDTIKSFKLENYLPVQILQKSTTPVYAADAGEIWADSFDSLLPSKWSKLWSREEGKVEAGIEGRGLHGSKCVVIKSQSAKDWAFTNSLTVEVMPGEMYEYSGSLRTAGKPNAKLCVVLKDGKKTVLNWSYASSQATTVGQWEILTKSFMVPRGTKYLQFRLIGFGAGEVLMDDVSFKKVKSTDLQQQTLTSVENEKLKLTLDPSASAMTVLDKRNNQTRVSHISPSIFITNATQKTPTEMGLDLINAENGTSYRVEVGLDSVEPTVRYSIHATDAQAAFSTLLFPPFFENKKSAYVVIPIQEGYLFRVDSLPGQVKRNLRYGGSFPMAFVGFLDDESGWMEIAETPNDFELGIDVGGVFENRWLPEKGKIGYDRKVSQIFFDDADYVEMAKVYRKRMDSLGLLKTLRAKDKERKNRITDLIGAVDVWYWGADKGAFIQDMFAAGVQKAVFSNAPKKGDVIAANEKKYLSSEYDIYQDVWPPDMDFVSKKHTGWPEDLVLDEEGSPVRGWAIRKDGKEYPGGVVCSIPGLARAKSVLPEILKDRPYRARFIDTTTASPWRECYNPAHPTSRSIDIENRMNLLKFCSLDFGLVTGTENGVDVAVPYADYFEGMMSPGLGRLPDSGRNVSEVQYISPTPEYLTYQVGAGFRIPLWELVFHDAAVSTWYWGDSNNRIPETWNKKDLFNILYGNMPLWAIRDWKHWTQFKKRFIESYQNVSPVFEKVGFEEMISHEFITQDHLVQKTVFANGISIYVNFGDQEYSIPGHAQTLSANGFAVFEGDRLWKTGQATTPSS